MHLGIGHIFSIVATFQAFFISAILIHKKNRNQSNWILSLIFFFFALLFLDTMASSREIMPQLGSIFRMIILFSNTPFVIAPLIFLMVRSVLWPDYKLTIKSSLHFIPFAIITIFFIYYWYPKAKIDLIGMEMLYNVIKISMLSQNLIYLILIISKLWTYKVKLTREEILAKLPRTSLIIYISITFVFLWVIDLGCLVLYDSYKNADFCAYSRSSYYTIGFVLLSLVLYWALLMPESMILKNKYLFSQLSLNKREEYKRRIVNYLNGEKAYLDPTLSLSIMADNLGISPKDLSQTLNQQFNKNFTEFINEFRIEEFKRQLDDINKKNQKYISEIYYAVGFNSKSAFYSAFKKATGITPKEYQQRIKNG